MTKWNLISYWKIEKSKKVVIDSKVILVDWWAFQILVYRIRAENKKKKKKQKNIVDYEIVLNDVVPISFSVSIVSKSNSKKKN